jgi:hypothetical protein
MKNRLSVLPNYAVEVPPDLSYIHPRMKARELYRHLKELAQKLDISVREKNLRNAGIHVRSGLCKVRGKSVFIMDKHLSLHQKAAILADCLREMPTEDVYMAPALREYLHGE